jgi:hypothetical protein
MILKAGGANGLYERTGRMGDREDDNARGGSSFEDPDDIVSEWGKPERFEDTRTGRDRIYRQAIAWASVVKEIEKDDHELTGTTLHELITRNYGIPIDWQPMPGCPSDQGAVALIESQDGHPHIQIVTGEPEAFSLGPIWTYAHECCHLINEHYREYATDEEGVVIFGTPGAAEELICNLFALAYLRALGVAGDRVLYFYTQAHRLGPGDLAIWSWEDFYAEVSQIVKFWEESKQ